MSQSADDVRYYAAAAYQSERVRRAANSLAGWTVTYLKNKGRDRAGAHAAYQFADVTVTLASVLVWNEIEADFRGKMAQDAAGIALAWDVVHEIPLALDAAHRLNDGNPNGMAQSDCAELAKRYATVKLAQNCLEICRLIPDRFSGPDGEARFKTARGIWREMHGVSEAPPATLDETLRCLSAASASPPAAEPPAEVKPAKVAKRRGRKPDTDPTTDRRIAEAWATGSYATYEELAKAMNVSKYNVKLAIDRHRKRAGRNRQGEPVKGF